MAKQTQCKNTLYLPCHSDQILIYNWVFNISYFYVFLIIFVALNKFLLFCLPNLLSNLKKVEAPSHLRKVRSCCWQDFYNLANKISRRRFLGNLLKFLRLTATSGTFLDWELCWGEIVSLLDITYDIKIYSFSTLSAIQSGKE